MKSMIEPSRTITAQTAPAAQALKDHQMLISVMLSDALEDSQVHNLHIEMELEDLKNLRDQLAYIFPFLEQEGSFDLLDLDGIPTDCEIFRSDVPKRSLWRSIAGLYYHLKGY